MPATSRHARRHGVSRTDARRRRLGITAGVSAVAGLGATLAPVTLTGSTAIDAIERAIVVGIVTFVGAHAHRWSWFVAGAIAAVPARGGSLVLVCLGLVVAILLTQTRRRSKPVGAIAVGLIANAVFWYPGALPTGVSHLVGATTVVILLGSGIGEVSPRHRRVVKGSFALAGLLVVVSAALAGWVALSSRSDVEAGTSSARAALAAVQRGDSEQARSNLSTAQVHLRRAHDILDGPRAAPAGLVPGLAQQVDAVEVSIGQALAVSEAAEDLVDTDYDRLRYQGRIDLDRVAALRPQTIRARSVLSNAEDRLDEVASRSLVPPLRDRLEELSDEVGDARGDADLASQLLEVAPGLLGDQDTRRYLVVFMTPAELRGGGGFVGNWVELEAAGGAVDLSRSGRIRELNDAAPTGQRTLDGPADYVARYGRLAPADNLQDVTFSPNWPSDASVYAQLYPQSGGRPVDGVIGIDPTGLAGLLELTGPVGVPGLDTPLTADNAVDLLTRDQYLMFDDSEAREQVLEAAIRATFERLTDASLPAPRRLGDVLGPVVRARHLQLWSPTSTEQRLFERLEADGRVAVPQGQDGLAVVQQNVANNKIDAYLRREVDYEATVDVSNATIRATVSITLRNEVPGLDLGRDVVGNNRGVPVGTNLTSLAVYTPHAVTSATIDGRAVELGPGSELGLRVWDTPLLAIEPGGSVTVELDLEGTLDLGSTYSFRYLPQPMAQPEELHAEIAIRSGRFTLDGGTDALRSDGPADETVVLRSGITG